ncbi:uncharacterized protein L3040_002118 [Drepanopeziza brunnea f. sp. 'multigermtubi']|uniref:uncharacterized protein n=1 Tax=Drepanopeziza brunnea f. sp. 'multigermtubi' TaxID=698441 RepID=UPI002392F2A0|nr:hypothetical protein L3040_002118 [Drepanopeziza brunnea f. sp. 'multigermtubi']
MGIVNPLDALILPFIFLFTLPVAFVATLTTIISISILFLRVLVVYGMISHPRYSSIKTSTMTPSTSSTLSAAGSITPISGDAGIGLGLSQNQNSAPNQSQSQGPSQSIGINPARDYEGVGGWRLDNNPSDDDGLWTNINSRLELPADFGRRHSQQQQHQRSRSGGSVNGMNTGRVRTSPGLGFGSGSGNGSGHGEAGNFADGGFLQQQMAMMIPGGKGRRGSVAGMSTGSSTSSKGSWTGGMVMKGR